MDNEKRRNDLRDQSQDRYTQDVDESADTSPCTIGCVFKVTQYTNPGQLWTKRR
jgi:hypothetical protein